MPSLSSFKTPQPSLRLLSNVLYFRLRHGHPGEVDRHWETYWKSIERTGKGGDVLWDSEPECASAEDLPRFVAVFGQVCQAVAYAHSKGVIHRDIKPANVMVSPVRRPVIMDFGIAKVTTAKSSFTTGQGVVIGTPSY